MERESGVLAEYGCAVYVGAGGCGNGKGGDGEAVEWCFSGLRELQDAEHGKSVVNFWKGSQPGLRLDLR